MDLLDVDLMNELILEDCLRPATMLKQLLNILNYKISHTLRKEKVFLIDNLKFKVIFTVNS